MECGEGELNKRFDVFLSKSVGFRGKCGKGGVCCKSERFYKSSKRGIGVFCEVRSEKWWSMGRVGEILLCFWGCWGKKVDFLL